MVHGGAFVLGVSFEQLPANESVLCRLRARAKYTIEATLNTLSEAYTFLINDMKVNPEEAVFQQAVY